MTLKQRRAAERRQALRRLRAPLICPMLGDGWHAQSVTAPLRGGPDSYLGQDERGRWRQVLITPKRKDLVAARYRDWKLGKEGN